MKRMPDFERAWKYSLNRLAHELSPKLTYHNLGHTENEVVPAADRIARLENVQDNDRLLLLTAAYYHDLGFIRLRQGHEAISIEIAEQVLPEFGYSPTEVVVVRNTIQATCIPQSPSNVLEKIMADADLDYLGQDNFWSRSADLRKELENFGPKFTDRDWYLYQLHFIQTHQYFTASQQVLMNAKKLLHIQEIQQQLKEAIRD